MPRQKRKWQLGDRVTSPTRLRRRVAGDRKTWEAEVFLGPVTGILVGTRVLQNGHKVWLGPDEGWGWKQEGTVRAALIATHLHRALVLVPLESLQHHE